MVKITDFSYTIKFKAYLKPKPNNTMKTKDGGPAFHSITCKGGDNFAPPNYTYHEGMSLRDYFAGQALAILADVNVNLTAEELAKCCYQKADAMIAAREVKP